MLTVVKRFRYIFKTGIPWTILHFEYVNCIRLSLTREFDMPCKELKYVNNNSDNEYLYSAFL